MCVSALPLRPYVPTAIDLWALSAPEGWSRTRLKYLFDSVVSGTWGTDADGGEDDIVCVRVADFDRTRRKVKTDNLTIRGVPAAECRSRGLRPGDLLIEKSGGGELQPVGFVVLFDHEFPAVCSNFIARLRPSSRHDPQFLSYVFAALYTSRVNGAFIKQTTGIQNLDLGAFLAQSWVLPPRDAQRTIARSVSSALRQLDSLVDLKRELHGALVEREAALINKIFDGAGEATRVKYCVTQITSGPRGWSGFAAPDGTMFLRITNVNRESVELLMRDVMYVAAPEGAERERTRVHAGDVLVSITADVGWSGIAREEHEGANVSQHVALMRPRIDRCRPEWLALALRTSSARSQFDAARYGGTKQQLALDDVGDIRIPLPELSEQDRLLARIQRESQSTTTLRARIAQQLELLDEHRATLIFNAVTGRVEM